MVEPMVTRLVLPLLGGSAAVWNTNLAFFQAALLVGYVYAHLLQRLHRIALQICVHVLVLIAAGLALPLHVAALFGEPSPSQPALWLLGVLAVSIGAPFAALSATAPLVQAWHARAVRHEGAREPYVLYAASNFGSLIALVAYPVLVEPTLPLHIQTAVWSGGYGLFVVLAAILGVAVWRAAHAIGQPGPPTTTRAHVRTTAWRQAAYWRERLVWLALAAIPSSLLLGVTTYITTDLGSAPFLWVAPLALYLSTFILAFQEKPAIRPSFALTAQAFSLALCGIHAWTAPFARELAVHLPCFFLTALVCHQALVARRPPAERLTDFYIWMSLGGVVGGAFNAFVAPLIFNTVVEYPAVLVLSCLVRPWGKGPAKPWMWLTLVGAVITATLAAQVVSPIGPVAGWVATISRSMAPAALALVLLGITAGLAFLLRGRALLFMAAILALMTASAKVTDPVDTLHTWRGFYGVLRLWHAEDGFLGDVKILSHGTTLHGAQSSVPAFRCRPLVYYAPDTPIGQVFRSALTKRRPLNIGVVGLGTGAVATYTRPGDSLKFYEIDPDPDVIRVATDPQYFSYTTTCARGHIGYVLGDARLALTKEPAGRFDVLLIDAFTSDSVPAHLLTVEAVRMYLSKLAPDGVLVLHLSNRNLDLLRPAQAVALAAGAAAMVQEYRPAPGVPSAWTVPEDAVIVGRSRAALAPFFADRRWSNANPRGVLPWTDDYTDLFGAVVRRTEDHLRHSS
jgi:predicted O-methyltransferase YrrM